MLINKTGLNGQAGFEGKRGADHSGTNGGNGGRGGNGKNGKNGQNVKAKVFTDTNTIVLKVNSETYNLTTPFTIDASGGDGGAGGAGGAGGRGGTIKNGSSTKSLPDGKKGPGGDGGNAGNGGNIDLSTKESHLLGLATLISRGGRGGRGGSGIPNGTSGLNGRDGVCTYRFNNQADSSFGMSLNKYSSLDDETCLDGNYTRKSKFSIVKVNPKNTTNIDIEPEFKICLFPNSNIKLTTEHNCFYNKEQYLKAHSDIVLEDKIDFEIDEKSDIGYYYIDVNSFSTKYDVRVNLDLGSYHFTIPINHRFSYDFIEKDIEDKESIKSFIATWDRKKPEVQLMFVTGVLLYPLLRSQSIDDDKLEKLLDMLKGKLFKPSEFIDSFFNDENIEDIAKNFELYKKASIDLYLSLPYSSRQKIIDMLFILASIDEKIEENEKKYIIDISNQLEIDKEWIKSEMPMLLESGDYEVKASAKNDYAMYLIPGLSGILLGTYDLIFNKYMDTTKQFFNHYLVETLFIFATFYLVVYGVRRFFFYKACHNCESTNLMSRSKNNKDTLLDNNSYQCKDCRSLGNVIEDDSLRLLASDTQTCRGDNIFYKDKEKTKNIIIGLNVIGFVLEPITTVVTGVLTVLYPKPIDKYKDYEEIVKTTGIITGGILAVMLVMAFFFG